GFRQKKMEKVQLYICLDCHKTFTQHITRGKHYPLPVMFDAISIYNLGYSLEETCRIVNKRHQKTAQRADLVHLTSPLTDWIDTLGANIALTKQLVKSPIKRGVDLPGIEPGRFGVSIQSSEPAKPTPKSVYTMDLQPSTLSNWLTETKELCRFERMREYALKKYAPKEMVISATLAHRQLYRYLFHRAKCELIIEDDFKHRRFGPLQEFLAMVPGECPHQYFQEGLRASEAPLTFSKREMIVRSKQNFATRLATFVLQSVKDRKLRHDAIQKFMLANDSVTIATEVPVYLTRDDLEHMQTQLGFEMFGYENEKLPKLITGHIDILQIRNGQIHILDYKPEASKERPIEQLTLYAMALSRLTGLRLFEFKCAWFDEKDYFEFFPLHVLLKPRKGRKQRKIYTMEGVYQINQDEKKITNIKPI
ncbi:MAG: PD-(D/E)XK nuclease family protein, partial [Candidatus Vogelbacteria bacterium]|nr:PD-(D/E)XK nuclease family protein [Candidatus Vogelbacteria bacterium]